MGGKPEGISQEVLSSLPTSAVLFQSSGSSGIQKWIAHTRQTLLASAVSVNRHLEVTNNDVFGLFLPSHHVGGFGILARAYEAKVTCAICEEKWDPDVALRFIEQQKVSITSLVPTQVYDLVERRLQAPPCLRAVIVGGGAMNEKLGQKARDLGWKVLQSYGMTEAGSQIATPSLASLNIPYLTSPLPILSIWEVSADEEERLSIRGDALAKGILQKEGNSWHYQELKGDFQTLDRVRIDERQLTFLGRIDRTIKVKGELVDLDNLEALVGRKLGRRVVFLNEPDDREGNVLSVYVEGACVQKDALQECLPKYLKLARIIILPEIPITSLGKVDRRALRSLWVKTKT